MNKLNKGFAPIIVLIVALLVAGLGGYVYFQSQDNPITSTTTTIVDNNIDSATTTVTSDTTSKDSIIIDQILVNVRENNSDSLYTTRMDVPKGELLARNNILDRNIINKYGYAFFFSGKGSATIKNYLSDERFSGINVEDSEDEFKLIGISAFSRDKKSAFIHVEVVDREKYLQYNPDSPRSTYPLLREEDYFCDFLKKECAITNIRNLIFNIFSKRFPDKKSISSHYRIFDSEKNILYGLISNPTTTRYLFAFDLNDQKKTQFLNLNIFNSNTSEISFSPNLNKFVVFEPRYDDIINDSYKKILWLYDTDNFANPIKNIDLSSFLGLDAHQITWSKDEKRIALYSISSRNSDIREIFVIDLDNDQVSQIWNKQLTDLDNFRGADLRLFLQGFSESGRYLIFQEQFANYDDWVLKAFDLEKNEEIELFKGYLDVLETF